MHYYFPELIRLRMDHGKTQTAIARELGISQTLYSRYELGKCRVPIEILFDLAAIYEIPLELVFAGKIKID